MSLFLKNISNETLIYRIYQLNLLTKFNETLASQQQITNTVNSFLKSCSINLKRQFWKNEKYSWGEGIEIVGISYWSQTSTERKKIYPLIKKVTFAEIKPDCPK